MPSGVSKGAESRLAVGLVGAAGLAFLFLKYRKVTFVSSIFGKKPLGKHDPHIVNTSEDCATAVNILKSKVTNYRVLGFDCEWVTQNGTRHPIALVQLASQCGYCVLFRLNKIQSVPKELKALLEDFTILKVGVAPIDDARLLLNDYAVKVNSTLDIRYLDVMIDEKPEGLAAMAAKHLKIKMDKDWKVRCSNWEARILNERQLNYAAADAHVAVVMFKNIVDKILRRHSYLGWLFTNDSKYWKDIEDVCSKFLNIKFKHNTICSEKKSFKKLLSAQQLNGMGSPYTKSHKRNYTQLIQNKIPYQNCYMQTPDGEILCTCDRKKAEWYVYKEIADVVFDEPFTIKLRFQPAGKSVGDVGRFYQMPRENRCVVCGKIHSYIRKNIIPKEYRRLFPSVMKDHSSHDVVLLCMDCHQLSNIQDQSLRNRLATMCNAPIYDKDQPKIFEIFDIKKVKSAARALLRCTNIPSDRKLELENVVLNYYKDYDKITVELLNMASDLDERQENPAYESHGELVIEHFKTNSTGLLELERLWREHFLETMQPNYMPELWSVTHTKSRLEIRKIEGRVKDSDLLIAGINPDPDTTKST